MIGYHRILRGIFRAKRTDRPYRLNVSLTRRCNSRCTTCRVWEVSPRQEVELGDELTTGELRRFFGLLPPSVMWVSFSGGEPSLRPDFVEVMADCFSRTPNLALVNVPTNGIARGRILAAWRELVRRRPRPFVRVSVSIDGPAALHDRLRGVPGNYERAMGLVGELQALFGHAGDAEVGVGVTVSRHNRAAVVPLLHELLDRGLRVSVEAAHTSPFYGHGDEASLVDDGVAETIAKAAGVLRRRLWRPWSPTDWLEAAHSRGTLRFLDEPSRLVLPCTAGRTSVAVDPYGGVEPCFFYTPGLGKLRDFGMSLEALLVARRAELAAARAVIAAEGCPRCWLTCNSIDAIIEHKRRAPWRRLEIG